jgi:hypothetical protein
MIREFYDDIGGSLFDGATIADPTGFLPRASDQPFRLSDLSTPPA